MARRSSETLAPAGREDRAEEPTGAYAPRKYSSREQILFAVKAALIVGALVLLLWVLDKTT